MPHTCVRDNRMHTLADIMFLFSVLIWILVAYSVAYPLHPSGVYYVLIHTNDHVQNYTSEVRGPLLNSGCRKGWSRGTIFTYQLNRPGISRPHVSWTPLTDANLHNLLLHMISVLFLHSTQKCEHYGKVKGRHTIKKSCQQLHRVSLSVKWVLMYVHKHNQHQIPTHLDETGMSVLWSDEGRLYYSTASRGPNWVMTLEITILSHTKG